MAELGSLGVSVRVAVSKAGGDVNTWIDSYTSKDGWTENFNSSGQETSLVDPHSVKTTYTYSSGLLANVSAPDGALVTLSYGADMMGHQRLNTITEAG